MYAPFYLAVVGASRCPPQNVIRYPAHADSKINNMYPARVAALLFELIAEVGLDIEQPGRQWLELDPPLDVDKFTDALLAIEYKGKPVQPALRAQVRARVLKHFLDANQESSG